MVQIEIARTVLLEIDDRRFLIARDVYVSPAARRDRRIGHAKPRHRVGKPFVQIGVAFQKVAFETPDAVRAKVAFKSYGYGLILIRSAVGLGAPQADFLRPGL